MMTSSARLVAFVAVLCAPACADHGIRRSAAADSTLVRDLALAGQQTAQPSFQDTAVQLFTGRSTAATSRLANAPPVPHAAVHPRSQRVSPMPVAQPASEPDVSSRMAGPVPTVAALGEIAAGTTVALTSGTRVCTSTNMPGDKLVATVNQPVTGTNGATIPAGASVVLEIASVSAGQTPDAARIVFRVRSVVVNDKTLSVAADVSSASALENTKVPATDAGANRNKVIGGAIAGALIGRVLGRSTKGTIIGAAAGAATGAAVAKSGERWQGCLPAGAMLRLTLTAPLVTL